MLHTILYFVCQIAEYACFFLWTSANIIAMIHRNCPWAEWQHIVDALGVPKEDTQRDSVETYETTAHWTGIIFMILVMIRVFLL